MHIKIFTFLIVLYTGNCRIEASYSVEELNLAEKVGQVLMVHFNGNQANEDAKILIQDAHIGSIIYYNWANDLASPMQVRRLSEALQKLIEQNDHPIPLLIAADQEGGVVARLTKGFTIFPGNKALGMTKDQQLAERYAFASGKELQAVGVNMNLAPVVDLNSNKNNSLIGVRSFSDSPREVVAFAKRILKGYRSAGIITTLKHFPGHGDVEIDSHIDLPRIKKNKEELAKTELIPFAELANDADVVMTAHLLVEALDPANCTTLSKDSLNLLRNDLGFKGVIITDSLVMEGLLKNCASIDDAAIRALEAGCDIVMFGGKQLIGENKELEITTRDSLRIHQAIVKAVQSGRISEERLNQSVQRVLELKNRYLANRSSLLNEPLNSLVNTQEHQILAKEIAESAICIQKNGPLSLSKPVDQSHVAIIAPEIARNAIEQTSLSRMGNNTRCLFFNDINPSADELQSAKELVENRDIIILCTYNAWKNRKQYEMAYSLLETGKRIIIIALVDPQDSDLFSKAHLVISTFSPTPPSIQAAADYISNPKLWHSVEP